MRRIPAFRNRAFFLSDAVLLPLCALIAFVARYDGAWPAGLVDVLRVFVFVGVPAKLLLLLALGTYARLWRYASVSDLKVLALGAIASACVDGVVGVILMPGLRYMPDRLSYSVILLDACLCALAIAVPRVSMRVIDRNDRKSRRTDSRRAIVAGAGAAGGMIVREMIENVQLGMIPVAIVDDDVHKHGMRLHNVPVSGSLSSLEKVARMVGATDLVVAMPSAPGRMLRTLVKQASEAGLQTRTVPGLYEIISGEKHVNALRQIEIQDLLRREPIITDAAQIESLVRGKVVMITGAGGSIGRELCRQVARLSPERLVALGRGENSVFELMQELNRSFPDLRVDAVIADVRDLNRMAHVFNVHRPYAVFHAAAHKHVPLMEANVAEAVLNNVLGTQNVATLSRQYGVDLFVLISTDKAVRATSVMGATKRIAEHIVHQCAIEGGHGFVSVRFGNVLGSRGSVVPTFMKQIAEGGPVTITHPDMTRFFMTIPEAVQLVLQAAALGNGGEVFVLDMGEPVRVADLATDLIRLSGLEPDVDIEIRCTGMRPGEKLYEELFFTDAEVAPTNHAKILRARDAEASEHNPADIEALIQAARENRSASALRGLLLKLVPEYTGRVESGEFSMDSMGIVPDVTPLTPANVERVETSDGQAPREREPKIAVSGKR